MFGSLWRWFWSGGPAPDIAPAGVFRRRDVARTFRRPEVGRVFGRPDQTRAFRRADQSSLDRVFGRAEVGRVFRRATMGKPIPYDTIAKPKQSGVVFVFDFSNFPEIATLGQTITGQTITGLDGIGVPGGITVGAPALLTTAFGRVPANKGVKVLISGGTPGTDYILECVVTFSGGGTDVVRGNIAV